MSFSLKGTKEPKQYEMALPVMTVDTLEAHALRTLCCVKHYTEDRYMLNRSSGFVPGNVNTLTVAGEYLEQKYAEMRQIEKKHAGKRK